ncbi:hypothetical protein SH584_09545 [Sphingomonas sp. LY29]|uniref:hypothetical protein n=1 Tax=Sphingomonas sp. LY29 TaxID=3095341 RepID=UPI002D77BEE3|nr:hypothetical protein [Sphingomonas sp. LY29]WRP25287.1 hypothetical protein SH584_09545 [Sphingomonas sp. LY29]
MTSNSQGGEMSVSHRVQWKILALTIGAVALPQAAVAQNSETPIDVTAAPPPTAGTVGPAQLRNFNLNGTRTQSSEAPAKTTAPAAPTSAPASGNGTASRPAAPRTAPTTSQVERQPAPTASTPRPARDTAAPVSVPTAPVSNVPDLSLSVPTEAAPAAPVSVAPSTLAPVDDPATPADGLPWAWIAALVALIGGGLFIWRSQKARQQRYGDFGRLAFAGGPDADSLPSPLPTPRPAPSPRAHPVPPRADPVPPSPRPDPAPVSGVRGDGMITASRLKPDLTLKFTPDRAVVSATDVLVQFDVEVVNNGSAPARDVLIEAIMVSAHAGQDRDIAEFFMRPPGPGDRIAGIPPLGRVSLKSAVRMPIDRVQSFDVEGRKLFVPLVALNTHYRSSAVDGHRSASFLVGRGDETVEKLAPFRLDLGPRIFRGLSARLHSSGLTSKAA